MSKEIEFEKWLYAIKKNGIIENKVIISNESELEFYKNHWYDLEVSTEEEIEEEKATPIKTEKYIITNKLTNASNTVEISDENELEIYKQPNFTIKKVEAKKPETKDEVKVEAKKPETK